MRLENGQTRSPLVASAAVELGFATVCFLIIDIPPHPAVNDLNKLLYGVASGVMLGFCLDVQRQPPFIRWLLFPVGSTALLDWLKLPGIESAGVMAFIDLGAFWLAALSRCGAWK